MKKKSLFIPTIVFNAMRRVLTKSQFGEVIASVADCITSGDDTPSPSICKGSDRYAFHEIVLEASKMQNQSSCGLRAKSSNGVLLPLLNINAMRDNLCKSDLAEVVLKAVDYCNGVQVETFDKGSAMAAYYSMLVHCLDVPEAADSAKGGNSGKKDKTRQRTKGKKEASVQQTAETNDAAKVVESANVAENADAAEIAEVSESATTVVGEGEANLPFIGETTNPAQDAEPTFEQMTAAFNGADNAEFFDKSRHSWEKLTPEEKRAALECAGKHKSTPEAPKYLYQYISYKVWKNNN